MLLKDATLNNVPESVRLAIEAVSDPSELRQVVLNAMREAGLIHGDDVNYRLTPQGAASSAPGQSLSANGYKCERTIRFHESTGRRALVIRGNSEEDLQALEHHILGY